MNFSLRNFFFLIILFFVPGLISAQVRRQALHVVKDNIACTYGLKNDSGRWVVPAQYTTLEIINNVAFIASNGSKYGVLNLEGKLVIPVVYDNVNEVGYSRSVYFVLHDNKKFGVRNLYGDTIIPFEYDQINPLDQYRAYYFLVGRNDLYGLIDYRGKMVLPVNYRSIAYDEISFNSNYSSFGYRFSNDHGVGYGDTSGIRLQPVYARIETFRDQDFYIVTENANPAGTGIVGKDGDTLLPIIYSDVWFDEYTHYPEQLHERFIVQLGDSFGVFDSLYHPIIPIGLKFNLSQSYFYFNSSGNFPFRENDTLVARHDEKWGFITGNGIWVTEQIYDSLIPPYDQYDNSYGLPYITIQNKKYGVLNRAGKVSVPPIYDSLKLYVDDLGRNYPTNLSSYFLVGKKENKYGIISSNGELSVPFIYDTIIGDVGSKAFFTTANKALLFERMDDWNYFSSYAVNYSTPISLDFCFNLNDSLAIYKGLVHYYAFDKPRRGRNKNLVPNETIKVFDDRINDKLIGVVVNEDDTLYFDHKGKPIINPLRGVNIVSGFNDNFIFRGKEDKLGIISKSGKIIVAPEFYGLSPASFEDQAYLWVKFQADTNCPFYIPGYDDCPCGWRLCDPLAHPVCKTIFDYPYNFTSNPQPVYVNGKAGLFDIKQRSFLIQPAYYNITPYNRNLFYVIRTNGQFGIADSTGRWVSDSTFTGMISMPQQIYKNAKQGDNTYFAGSQQLIIGNSKRMILDFNGKIITDSVSIDSLILASFFMRDYRVLNYATGGSIPIPQYLTQGPSLKASDYFNKTETYSYKDSLVGAAIRFSMNLLLGKYKYVFLTQPREGYAQCNCITQHINPAPYSIFLPNAPDSISLHYYGGSQFSQQSAIAFLSRLGFSLLLNFNPDSSAAAASRTYAGPYYQNFRTTATGFVPCTLDSIFCPDVNYAFVLNKLMIEAISKRDDLNLDCNNPESYFFLSHQRFCLTPDGLLFFIDHRDHNRSYADFFTVLIPWKEIQPYSRPGGIVDDFIGNSSGEHCKLPLDTTVIDFKFQKYFRVNDFANSNLMKRVKVKSCSYFISGGNQITGIRFYCEGNTVYDVYFKSTKNKSVSRYSTFTLNSIPENIGKKRITKLICIRNFPCK